MRKAAMAPTSSAAVTKSPARDQDGRGITGREAGAGHRRTRAGVDDAGTGVGRLMGTPGLGWRARRCPRAADYGRHERPRQPALTLTPGSRAPASRDPRLAWTARARATP